jgi:D-methionine transport system ATP-binding protein
MSEDILFKLTHVTKVFGIGDKQVKAIDDVSLEIRKGEIFGIIGMSGAGKSTLVRTLNGLEKVSGGTVFFEGQSLNEMKGREIRKARQSMGMIFQGFNLMKQKDALRNVELPMKISGIGKKERRQRALEMIRTVGLEEKVKAYPSELSGGQKQRLAIARALTMRPKVLLCDEATSALDPKITLEILNLLQDINIRTGITIIIITHEMDVIEKICSRVAIIDNGKLSETGEVTQIFTNPQSLATKRLVFPSKETEMPFDMTDRRCLRIVFDGHSARETIICNLVEETGEKINILAANTKSVAGQGFGQMIIELPDRKEGGEKVLEYFRKHGVHAEEIGEEE